jgi:hypothetical protein
LANDELEGSGRGQISDSFLEELRKPQSDIRKQGNELSDYQLLSNDSIKWKESTRYDT